MLLQAATQAVAHAELEPPVDLQAGLQRDGLGLQEGVARPGVDRLVPYGAMTATFYTGMGCLLVPSIFYLVVRAITG